MSSVVRRGSFTFLSLVFGGKTPICVFSSFLSVGFSFLYIFLFQEQEGIAKFMLGILGFVLPKGQCCERWKKKAIKMQCERQSLHVSSVPFFLLWLQVWNWQRKTQRDREHIWPGRWSSLFLFPDFCYDRYQWKKRGNLSILRATKELRLHPRERYRLDSTICHKVHNVLKLRFYVGQSRESWVNLQSLLRANFKKPPILHRWCVKITVGWNLLLFQFVF